MSLPEHVRHLVVGAGFAGLCAAIELAEAGEDDVLVIERGDDVGGTWRDNTYPGAACDVPSQLYSFSFALNPDWSRSYSPQPEIQAYLRRVAQDSGLLDRFRFGVTMLDAAWDDEQQVWRVHTSNGDLTAAVLISGTGALSEPRLPDIKGLDGFQGRVFHSARWPDDLDLTGKRVAVIGTGASAIQIVPELQRRVAHLDLYQRTPAWVLPRTDRRYTRLERMAFRHLPWVQRLYRAGVYAARESYVPAFTWQPKLARPAQRAGLAHLHRAISDPDLRARLTPDFDLGCKRVLLSNDYYPALAADNVDLVTDGIAKVTGDAVVTADGVERPVDAIVVCTGFQATEQPVAGHLRGREGRLLSEVWADEGMAAYRGTTVAGFPNLFLLVGPNTGLGHSSMVFVIESQVAYLVDALRRMRLHSYAAVDPKPRAQQRWNAALQRRMRRTVWSAGGCRSWYLDRHGRNTTLWPRTTMTLRRQLRRFDLDSYDARMATAARHELDLATADRSRP